MSYYGNSGDVRADLNGGIPSTHDNYQGEDQTPGALIERGRRWAYSIINAKLEARYADTIPWTSGLEPALIYEISNLLSEYFVISKQNVGNAALDENKVKELYDNPMEILDKLAEGDMELPEAPKPIGETGFFSHDGIQPACDMDPIEDNKISTDLLDGIADARE